jgi:hypothetical protein
MTLVGSLAGTLDGRPWSLEAAEQTFTLNLAGFASLLTARRGANQLLSRVAVTIPLMEGRVRLKVGSWPAVSIGSVSKILWLLGVDRAGERRSL